MGTTPHALQSHSALIPKPVKSHTGAPAQYVTRNTPGATKTAHTPAPKTRTLTQTTLTGAKTSETTQHEKADSTTAETPPTVATTTALLTPR